jgi:hypothetical protein
VSKKISHFILSLQEQNNLIDSYWRPEAPLSFMAHNSETHCIGRAIAQAVSRRLLAAETGIHAQVSPCGICGGQKWHWDRFFSESFGFPLSVSLHRYSVFTRIMWGMGNGPISGRSSTGTKSHPVATITNLYKTVMFYIVYCMSMEEPLK